MISLENIKPVRGDGCCPKCGKQLQKMFGGHIALCMPCLREVETQPPYPCNGCHKYKDMNCTYGKRCRAWFEWALITWRLFTVRAKQLMNEKN